MGFKREEERVLRVKYGGKDWQLMELDRTGNKVLQ